jgi:adenylate cyclase, class 2
MEIEIKARLRDKEKIKSQLKILGATEKKKKHQLDRYYNHPTKDIRETNEYIRLRYLSNENEGIFCYHINLKGATEELEVAIKDIDKFKKILELSGYKKLGLIDKKRETFVLKDFEITLDEVKNVGNFIEIETEGNLNEVKEKKVKCIELLKRLELCEKDLCDIWLCDIATKK